MACRAQVAFAELVSTVTISAFADGWALRSRGERGDRRRHGSQVKPTLSHKAPPERGAREGEEVTFDIENGEDMQVIRAEKTPPSTLPAAEPVRLAELVAYADGAIVSRALSQGPAGSLTVFAFDKGQKLSEHTAPFDAFVNVLEGETLLTVGGQRVPARAGETVRMPADIPHAVEATGRFKMLLVMLRQPRAAGPKEER